MERLHESVWLKDLSSTIINNAFDAIIYYHPVRDKTNTIIDFEFVFMNDSAFKYLSGTRENYNGKRFLSLFPYAAIDGMFDAFKNTAETGKPSEEIYYYEHGEYKGWYRDSVIKYGDGIIVYFRDVTEYQMLERELKSKSSQLEKLLDEKEILLRESHHRIKNNLQLLVSMLNLQSHKITDLKLREILDVTKQRILNIAKMHQRLYEDKIYSTFNLDQFIRDNANSLMQIYKDYERNIEFKYEIEELNLNLDNSINIGLIINELLTNCIKYAFKGVDKGEINISIKNIDSNLRINISDNGIGMPIGFQLEKFNTLGLVLVKALSDQMSGTLSIVSPPGTTFIINLPIH